ncbi:hypothetical protein Lal_00027854 [Lupinus albus]|nr:hypothetical protein Lal_00027854 [Lupinus albus]
MRHPYRGFHLNFHGKSRGGRGARPGRFPGSFGGYPNLHGLSSLPTVHPHFAPSMSYAAPPRHKAYQPTFPPSYHPYPSHLPSFTIPSNPNYMTVNPNMSYDSTSYPNQSHYYAMKGSNKIMLQGSLTSEDRSLCIFKSHS